MRKNETMDEPTRTTYAIKNAVYGLLGKIISILAAFASRTVFIIILGKYYLGVNGLYAEVLSVLSLAELGFGSAITFSMYKPVAEKNEEQICQLLSFYKMVYHAIAATIFVLGMALIPFLQYIIHDSGGLSIDDLRLFFVIYLTNSVTTYFVTYRYTLLNAMQKTYIATNIETVLSIICAIIQVIALFISQSFLIYLLSNTATVIISRIAIMAYLDSHYPLLKRRPKRPLSVEARKMILNEVKGLSIHQLSSVAIHSTDNLIIAMVPTLGIAMVGAVSNYTMIIGGISSLALILFNSVVAGFGNIAATESKERFRDVFYQANFISFIVYGLFAATLFALLTPFIELWAGPSYCVDDISLLLMLINFYLQGQCVVFNNARIAVGNFNLDKWWSLLQAIVNLVVSVFFARRFGLVGVYIGTVASRLVFIVTRPASTYRFMFDHSPMEYYASLVKLFLAVVVVGLLCVLICKYIIPIDNWASFVGAATLCFLSTFLFFYCSFKNTKAFMSIRIRIISIIRSRSVA